TGALLTLKSITIPVQHCRAQSTPGASPMRRVLSLFALLLLASPSLAADTKPVSLFDGKTLTGWEGDEKTWKVEDGAIVGGSLEAVVPRNEFLCTTTSYGDFELKLKFKLLGDKDKANGGGQVRAKPSSKAQEGMG